MKITSSLLGMRTNMNKWKYKYAHFDKSLERNKRKATKLRQTIRLVRLIDWRS
jgi:formiminotetrahydrofolate cyclodeaminase